MVSVTFKGGDKLKAELTKILRKAKNARSVDIGFMGGSTEADGTSIPMIAAIQEYGAPSRGIPPRPFFRNMIEANKDKWAPILAGAMKASGNDAERSLGILGQEVQEELQDSIRSTNAPPLSPVTVMLRGMRANKPGLEVTAATVGEAAARVKAGKTSYGASVKPLVDSGTLLRSVTHKVNR